MPVNRKCLGCWKVRKIKFYRQREDGSYPRYCRDCESTEPGQTLVESTGKVQESTDALHLGHNVRKANLEEAISWISKYVK